MTVVANKQTVRLVETCCENLLDFNNSAFHHLLFLFISIYYIIILFLITISICIKFFYILTLSWEVTDTTKKQPRKILKELLFFFSFLNQQKNVIPWCWKKCWYSNMIFVNLSICYSYTIHCRESIKDYWWWLPINVVNTNRKTTMFIYPLLYYDYYSLSLT